MVRQYATTITIQQSEDMPESLFLAGDRIELRTIEREDIDIVKRWMNHPEIRRHIHEFRLPFTRGDYESWMEREHDTNDRVDLLVCSDGEPVGRVRLVPLRDDQRCANLAFLISPDYQGTDMQQRRLNSS